MGDRSSPPRRRSGGELSFFGYTRARLLESIGTQALRYALVLILVLLAWGHL